MTCIGVESGNVATGSGSGFNHTLTAKGARQVWAWTTEENTGNATAMTYNGVNMTNVLTLSRLAGGTTLYSSLWVILDKNLPAAAGSYAISGTFANAGRTGITVVEVNNVAQVVPSGAQVDSDTEGDVTSNTINADAFECGETVGLGWIGIGQSTEVLTVSGTGTWNRLNQQASPPTSARMGSSWQVFTSGGSKNNTESTTGGWARACHGLVMVQQAQTFPMMGANF